MKCLVIGAAGQVGRHLLACCIARGYDGVGTIYRVAAPDCLLLDLRDTTAIREMIQNIRPDVVFLAAALTNVDRAERTVRECILINSHAPAVIAETLSLTKGSLVFFSTDHVFDTAVQPRSEEHRLAPVHIYGQSKADAEHLIRDRLPDRHLIIRTSWVYGPEEQRKNFAYRTVETLQRGETLLVPNDQHGSPTYSPDLAACAVRLWERGVRGTMHVVGPDYLSRFAFAELIADVCGLERQLILGIPTVSLRQAAPRPAHVRLCRSKLLRTLGCDPIRPPAIALESWRNSMWSALEYVTPITTTV